MKLQLQGQRLRLRIDESELTALREDAVLENTTMFGTCAWQLRLHLAGNADPALQAEGGHCTIAIPRHLVEAYAARLPCRDGLSLQVQPAEGRAVELVFEVDVRDSLRTRGLRRA
jgi:hypothetical protein